MTHVLCPRASGGDNSQPHCGPPRKPFQPQFYRGEVGLEPSPKQGNCAVRRSTWAHRRPPWTTSLTSGGLSQQRLPGLSNLTFPVWLEAPQRGMFTLGKKG